jgi:hypothetical protein
MFHIKSEQYNLIRNPQLNFNNIPHTSKTRLNFKHNQHVPFNEKTFLAYFPYFEKIKGVYEIILPCVYVSPPQYLKAGIMKPEGTAIARKQLNKSHSHGNEYMRNNRRTV